MKKSVKIIIISTVAVLLLAAATIATFIFWGDRVTNAIAITFKNPEDYYAWYLNRGVKKLEIAGDLVSALDKADDAELEKDKGNYLIKLSTGLSGEDFISINAISGNDMEKLLVSLPDYRRDYVDVSEVLTYEIGDGRSISSLLEEVRKKREESGTRDDGVSLSDISLKYSDFVDKLVKNTTEVSLKKGEKEFTAGEKRTFNTISAVIDGIGLVKEYTDFDFESYIPEEYREDFLETKYYLDINTDKTGKVLELRFTVNVKGSDYSLKLTPESIRMDSDEGAVIKVKTELTMNLVGLIEIDFEVRINNGQLSLGLDVSPQKLVAAFLGEKAYKLHLALTWCKDSESYTSVALDTTVFADGETWFHLNVTGSEIPDSSIPDTGYTISDLLTSDYLDLNAAVGYLLFIVDRLPQNVVDELMETVSSEIGINISIDMIRNLYESGMLSLISGLLKSFGGNDGLDIGSILGGGLGGGIGGLGGLGGLGGFGGGLIGGLGSFGTNDKTDTAENLLPENTGETSEYISGNRDASVTESVNNPTAPMSMETPEEEQTESEQGTPEETEKNEDKELSAVQEEPVKPESDTENSGESESENPTDPEDAASEEPGNESDVAVNTETDSESNSDDESLVKEDGASTESETLEVDVDALIAAFLDSYRDRIETAEKPQSVDYGDIVTVDIIPILFGEPFLDMAQYGFQVRMGDNFFGQDLDERFFGVAVGETKEVYAVLDEDFGDLAGLGLDFIVTLTDIKRYIKPEWNEAFIVDVLGYESLDACLESILGDTNR